MKKFDANFYTKNGFNPFYVNNGCGLVFLYIDQAGLVVYCDTVDSLTNFPNRSLRRYAIPEANVGIFIRYYELRLHPRARKNVTNK